jgi:hypothetical protein
MLLLPYKISSKSGRNKINPIYFNLQTAFYIALCDIIVIFAPYIKILQMKRFFFAVSISCLLLSCAKKAAPGEVAVSLFNALTSGEAQIVRDNIYFADNVERSAFYAYLDMAYDSKDFAERTKGYKADYKVVSEKIDGDSAFVVLLGKTALAQDTRFNVLMVKIDGEWKVDGRFSVLHPQNK